MPNNDSHHHVVKTTEQWQDRAVEYWVVPRGTLCVELTPEKKTKIKIGEGSKYYSQLPYICDGHDMSNYYTKEETDRLLDNLNRMAIQSTDVYDTKDDLPLDGNKLGDVRFVRSTSEQKVDPDVYLWNGSKWIYVGYDFANIDLDRYLTKTEFHSEFDPVRDKVDEMYPKMHTHDNKDVLDRIERPFTIADKEKLDSLHNYDDTEIRELIRETGHVHWNKHILDTITEDKLWTVQDREKFESLHNYDDTELRNRMGVVESKAHTHTNKDILDQTTAPFKTEDKQKLDSLENYDIFIGTDGRYPGVKGLVPAPSTLDIGTFLSSDGTWKKAGFDSDFVGATPYMDGEHGLVPAPLMGEQSYFLRGDGTWARVKNGDKYKAGEGIYILSGEVTSDSFPFEIFTKASRTSQYVIYGSAAGVGDWDGTNYTLSITVSAPGETTLTTQILYNARLYSGDYVDYARQIIHHSKQDMRQYISLYNHSSYGTESTVQLQNGTVAGNYYIDAGVTNYIEVNPGEVYLVKAFPDAYIYYDDSYHCIFDENHNVTRYFAAKNAGAMTIEIQPGEKYARFVGQPASGMLAPGFLYKLEPYEEPCVLPSIILYPNKINTIDVSNTNKPSEIYFEAISDEPLDPDDPMSEYTGIIYNDGVIDVTQEDPNNLNELTIHFRDDVDKTLTIPATPLPIASDTTLGGIKVGNNLTIDPVTGVLDATGGTTYVEGDGIEFGYPVLETYQVLDKIRKPSGTTLTTDVMPSGTVDFFCDLKYYKYSGDSFLILCYNGERGSFCYTPPVTNSSRSTRMWIYTAHENWYDLYLNDSVQSSNPITVHLRWGTTMSISFDHTTRTAQNSPGVLPGHNLFSFDSSSDADLYWAKFYENSALVGELVPVIRQSDSAVGMFNKVTETFSTVSGLIAGTPTGETIVIYDQSSTQNIPINAKLGDGLSFDSNDAITVDEMVGADGTNDGEAGVVPTPLASDNTKFLRGDGTWAIPGSSVTYAAGDGITFTHPGMTDLGFDFDAFVAKITSINNGTKTVDSEHKVLTLTATGDDCYTKPYSNTSVQNVYTLPIVAGHVYRLTWDSSNPSVPGRIFAFENVSETNLHQVHQSVQDYLEFTAVTSGTINFRFGVQNPGDTISYSNIHFYEMDNYDPDTTIINADISKGLEFDSDDKLQVKLGDGLHFDSNDAIELDSNLYYPGQGIEFGGETLIPTEFNQSAFINVIGANRGNISKTPALDAFTLTATGDDCFTDHYEGWDGYYITAEPNTKYRVSWESANGTSGNMFVFEVSGTSYTGVMYIVNNANTNVNIFTTSSTCTKLSLRFGVASTGNSERYSNITFDKVVPLNNVIKAKLGDGLSFDSNDAIEVQPATENSIGGIKVGEGLSVAQDGTLDVITDVITTFAEGDAIEFGTTPVPLTETITHIKWAINTIRNSSLSIIQAAEIEFYDENDQLLTFSAVSGAFSPSVSTRPTYGTNQYSQTPDKLVDGSTAYKCCCTNFTSSVPEIEFTFELSTPINAQDLKNYRWFTADDQEGRDPISWEVYVSPNGGDWICVHEVTNATVPTARQTSTEYYTVNKPSFGERTINVKYGAGLALDENGALTVVGGGGGEYDAGPGIEIGPSPSELYTQVEYLKSTGTQTILTDIQIGLTNRYVADIKLDTFLGYISETRSYIFGGSHYLVQFGTNSDQSYASFLLGVSWSGSYGQIAGVSGITERGTIIAERGSSTCSWTTGTYGTQTTSVGTAEYSDAGLLTIFGTSAASAYNSYEMRLYSFKIYDSTNQLVNDLVPVKRNSDDELGLYDLITDTFYTNTGTGTFTAGSEIGPVPGDNEVISAKLGYGLSFDNNDAITLDETAELVFNCDYSE